VVPTLRSAGTVTLEEKDDGALAELGLACDDLDEHVDDVGIG
jgi:hypothetical protein